MTLILCHCSYYQVASSLEPLDLIYLSRVNKEFRATFMSRSARFVWTRVLESVPGLPSCPPDMTEPQYVSLIFEQLCSVVVYFNNLRRFHLLMLYVIGMRKCSGLKG